MDTIVFLMKYINSNTNSDRLSNVPVAAPLIPSLGIKIRFKIILIENTMAEIETQICSFFMATRDIFKAFLLTVVFVIIRNEFLPTEKEDSEDDKKKGGSYNKKELDKTIHKLKSIQATM